MYKLFITVALLVSSLAYAKETFPIKEEKQEDKNCAYVAVGGLMPTITFGGRAYMNDEIFLDISSSISTIFIAHQLDLTLRCLNKYNNNNNYIGGGLEGVLAFNDNCAFTGLSAIATHGWDRHKDFTEISLSFPLYKIRGYAYIPHFIIKYGWKF